MLKRYTHELIAIRAGVQRPSERPRPTAGRIKCAIPLTEQIVALMRSLPPAQRDRPWYMEELLARLQGRYTARPCAGEIGVALRRLGWTRSRDWSLDGDGRRLWRSNE